MIAISPLDCPACRPYVSVLQRYLDGNEVMSVEEVLAATRRAVDGIRRIRCNASPECLLLPVALRLLLREDLERSTRVSLQSWVDSVGPILSPA